MSYVETRSKAGEQSDALKRIPVDLPNSFRHLFYRELLHPFPATGASAAAANFDDAGSDWPHLARHQMMAICLLDQFGGISHIDSDNRQVAGQSLLDGVGRTF